MKKRSLLMLQKHSQLEWHLRHQDFNSTTPSELCLEWQHPRMELEILSHTWQRKEWLNHLRRQLDQELSLDRLRPRAGWNW